MESLSHHITPLVVHSLGGGHTLTHTHAHTHTHTHTPHTHTNTHTHAHTDTHPHTHTRIQTFLDRSNSKKPGAHLV